MAWKVWFDDGTTFDNTQGGVSDVPNKGVVCVAIAGQPVVSGQDWYVYSTSLGRFATMTLQQLLYQVMNSAPGEIRLVRQGASVSKEKWTVMSGEAEAFAAG